MRAQEEYNQYFLSIVQEILTNYAVDGIHLDYLRYTHTVYCFCPTHQKLMAAQGIDFAKIQNLLYKTYYSPADQESYMDAYTSGDPDVSRWVEQRISEIDAVANGVKGVLDGYNAANGRHVVLSAALMPEDAVSSYQWGNLLLRSEV